MTVLTLPHHTRDGCLNQFTPDARAAMLHERYAAGAAVYATLASDVETSAYDRRHFRQEARRCAREARDYFERCLAARRRAQAPITNPN